MPIRLIPNQPIKLSTFKEPRFCQNGIDYCFLHQNTDPFRMQFKQTSFGASPGSCDPQFSTVGAELVTNGGFTGSAAGWTLTNANYGSNNVCFDGSPTAIINQSPLAIVDTDTYRVQFTVSGLTTGTFEVNFGNSVIQTITADGVYSVYIDPGNLQNITFTTNDGCDACITNVSIKQLFPCWAYDNLSFISSFNDKTFGLKITHIPGSATTFTADDALISGGYYECQIRVQGRTQGSVQMFAGDLDVISTPITQNGTFTQYLTANETGVAAGDPVDFLFTMDADFDGTIEYVFTNVLRTDFICMLIDADGTPVADLSSRLFYNDDYVTLSFAGLNSLTDLNGDPIEEGCYNISLTDTSEDNNLLVNGNFFDEDPGQTSWNETGYFTGNITSGTANAISDGSAVPVSQIQQLTSVHLPLDATKWYIARFRYRANFVDPTTMLEMRVAAAIAITGITDADSTWKTAISAPFQPVNLTFPVDVIAYWGDDTAGNTIVIDDVEVIELGDFISNCINYKESHPGTYLVVGRSNFKQSPESGPVYGFGFLFQPRNLYVFHLIQRLALGFRKPTYPLVNQAGAYSTGTHYKSFSSTEKVFEVVFEPMGEIEHDAMAVMIQCPSFYIQGAADGVVFGEATRYHCINDDYTPLYDDLGANKNTRSIIQVQHIQDIVKISNT